ncbi:hypothetical protein VNO78_27021 [Psophocarpus tetragonolobus]|uniref:Uncharacterized protein n=1 Tax=Psophocarpus tetragonolobus TaxID=3891 RepID=A0AAN9XAJ8_PSOTE
MYVTVSVFFSVMCYFPSLWRWPESFDEGFLHRCIDHRAVVIVDDISIMEELDLVEFVEKDVEVFMKEWVVGDWGVEGRGGR